MSQIMLGTLINLITLLFHVVFLVGLSRSLQFMSTVLNNCGPSVRLIALTTLCMFGIMFAHVVHGWIWAVVYLTINEFDSLENAVYFSLVTATTLGFGDITLSSQWRLLSTFEAMGGLVLFGASTAFLMAFMSRFFHDNE